MRYLTADYIFPISSIPVKNGTVVIDDNGIIIEILKPGTLPINTGTKSEIHKGIICPGFINAHCHLELSHMKGIITEGTGLAGFISEFLRKRKQMGEENIQQKIIEAENEMRANGIVGVGDISNNDSTFSQKTKGNLFYHTFIELFDLIPEKAKEVFENGKRMQGLSSKVQNSIVPHAPYSVSHDLLEMIYNDAIKKKSILSIHNQETESENDLFINKSGKIFGLFKSLGINLKHLPVSGKSSLQSYLNLFPKENKILLVHNTYTTTEDIEFAEQYSKNIYWCFCPNANLYIENHLPVFKIFIEENAKCCVGTDSYASNRSLSILEELKTISKHAPEIPLQTLLQWATLNGAEFLGAQNQFGSIEKNKKPGLNLIENVDLENLKLTKKGSVRKIA